MAMREKNPPAITLEQLATREEIEKSATADIGLDKKKKLKFCYMSNHFLCFVFYYYFFVII
jgi:hypothetical protein